MAGRTLVPMGRLEVSSDLSVELLITNATRSRNAVDARIRSIAPGIIADAPAVTAAAAAAVAGALASAGVVTAGKPGTTAVMSWGVQDVAVPATVPASVPAASTFNQSSRVALVGANGQLDPSLLPATDTGTDLPTEFAVVARRGRPAYAPTARDFDPVRSLYNYNPSTMLSWIEAREKARRGRGVATILSLGTSISQVVGDVQAGETWANDSWPAQLQSRLGLPIAGTGIRHVSLSVPVTSHVGGFVEPTITIANPASSTNKIEVLERGFAQSTFVTITDSGTKTAYVEFNTAAGAYTKLRLYGGEISGTSIVTIDGVDYTWAGSTSVTGADIPCLTGFASGQRIAEITLPNTTHTVRAHGTAAGVPFSGFEGRTGGAGTILHRGAIAGRSQYGFFVNSGTNLDGLEWAVDPWQASLAIDELHINDWQGHRSVAEFKAQKIELWSRQRAKGASVLCVVAPAPDLAIYPSGDVLNNPALDLYHAAIYEAADQSNAAVLDLNHRWGGYPNSARFYKVGTPTDHIHPIATGLSDFATAALAVLNA